MDGQLSIKELVKVNQHIESRLAQKQAEIDELKDKLKENFRELSCHIDPGTHVLVRIGANVFHVENNLRAHGAVEGIIVEPAKFAE